MSKLTNIFGSVLLLSTVLMGCEKPKEEVSCKVDLGKTEIIQVEVLNPTTGEMETKEETRSITEWVYGAENCAEGLYHESQEKAAQEEAINNTVDVKACEAMTNNECAEGMPVPKVEEHAAD
jgi:hypothetical protein